MNFKIKILSNFCPSNFLFFSTGFQARKTKSKKKFKGNVQIKEIAADGSYVVIQNKSSKKVRKLSILSSISSLKDRGARCAIFLLQELKLTNQEQVSVIDFAMEHFDWLIIILAIEKIA